MLHAERASFRALTRILPSVDPGLHFFSRKQSRLLPCHEGRGSLLIFKGSQPRCFGTLAKVKFLVLEERPPRTSWKGDFSGSRLGL